MGLASDQHTSIAQQDDKDTQTPSSSSSSASPKRMGSSTSKPVNSKKRAGQPYEIVVEVPARPSSSSSASRLRKSPSNKSQDADIAMSPTKKQKVAPTSPLLGFPVSPTRKSRSNTPLQPAPDSVENRVIHATNSLENLTTYTPSQNKQRTRAKSRDRSVSPTPSFEVPVPSGQAFVLQDLPSSSQLTSLSRQQASSPYQRDVQDTEMAIDSEQEADMTLDNIGGDDYSSLPSTSQQLQGLDGKLVTVTSKPKAGSGKRIGTAPHRGVGRPRKSATQLSPEWAVVQDERKLSEELEATPATSYVEAETSTRRKLDAFIKERGIATTSSVPVQGMMPKGSKKVVKPRKSATKTHDVDAAVIMSNYGERSKRSKQQPVKYASERSSSELEEAEVTQKKKKVQNGKGKARDESEEREGAESTDVLASDISGAESSTAKRTNQPKKRKSSVPKANAQSVTKKRDEKQKGRGFTASDTGSVTFAEPSEPEDDTDDNGSNEFSLKPASSKKVKASPAKVKETKSKVKRPIKAKPASPAPVKSKATLSRKPLQRPAKSESDDDDATLPSLLPTSSFVKLSQPKWDLQLLDEAVFVALPGRPKKAEEDEDEPTASEISADVPRFWWPARINSRNRQNFRVKVVLDARKEEILKYTSPEPVIPQDQLVESGIVNLKDSITDEIRFGDIAAATATFRNHDMASLYTHPSEAAFKAAIRKGRQVPEHESTSSEEEEPPAEKRKSSKKRKSKTPRRPGNVSSDDLEGESLSRKLLEGMFSSQTRVESGSEDEELDPEIDVGTCGLGRSDLRKATEEWWPAKVVAIRSMEEVKTLLSQKSSSQVRKGPRKTTKNGPYCVEFYPGETGRDPVFWLWREHLLLSTDADFKRVPLGPMEERKLKDDNITPEDFESIREPLQRLLKGDYPPGANRVNLFFGSKADRAQLQYSLRYGDFPESHKRQTSDYIQSMLDTPDVELDPRISKCPQEERIAFVASVALLVALELLVIHDGDLEEQAKEQLEEQGLPSHRESVELKAHELAVEVLDNKKDWYKSVLNWRENVNTIASIDEGIQIDKKELLGFVDTGSRSKIRKNYKE